MSEVFPQVAPWLSDAASQCGSWVGGDKAHLRAVTLGMKNCVEHFISAVATTPALREHVWIMSHAGFRSEAFARFVPCLARLIDEDARRVVSTCHGAIDHFFTSSAAASLANSLHEVVALVVPPQTQTHVSSSSSAAADASTQGLSMSTVQPSGFPTNMSIAGLPPLPWPQPIEGEPPEFATRFHLNSALDSCVNVESAYNLWANVLNPLDAHYGDGATGIKKGRSWRGTFHRPGAGQSIWKISHLISLFSAGISESTRRELQARIDRYCS